MSWYTYSIAPIDFKWHLARTVKSVIEDLAEAYDSKQAGGGCGDLDLAEFMRAWDSARHAAGDMGWDGDCRYEPVMFAVPCQDEFQFGFVIKQDNNGYTYVISPIPLPHLED